jgi:hypothetical protein
MQTWLRDKGCILLALLPSRNGPRMGLGCETEPLWAGVSVLKKMGKKTERTGWFIVPALLWDSSASKHISFCPLYLTQALMVFVCT